MKIFVDVLPKTSKECPFALHCFEDKTAYPIFKLKYRNTYENVSFSFVPNKFTCPLNEGKECNCLKLIN